HENAAGGPYHLHIYESGKWRDRLRLISSQQRKQRWHHLIEEQRLPGQNHGSLSRSVQNDRVLVRDAFNHLRIKLQGFKLVRRLGSDASENSIAAAVNQVLICGIQFDHSELPFDIKYSSLQFRYGFDCQIGNSVNGKRRSDLDDQTVISRQWRIATSAYRSGQIGRKLRPQVRNREIDTKLGHCRLAFRRRDGSSFAADATSYHHLALGL